MQIPQKKQSGEKKRLAITTIQNHISSAGAKMTLWKPGDQFSQPQAQQHVCWGAAVAALPAATCSKHQMVLGKTQQYKDLHLGIQLWGDKEPGKSVRKGKKTK